MSGNTSSVTLLIDANGDAVIKVLDDVWEKFKDFGNRAINKSRAVTSWVSSQWSGTSKAISAAFAAAQKAWNLAEQAAGYEQSRQAFNRMVTGMGLDANREFAKIRAASAGLVDMKGLAESSNKAMSLGIPVGNIAKLMEMARARAREMGTTTSEAFDEIITGVGAATRGLSTYDQRQAAVNTFIDAGADALKRHNLESLTTLERMQKLKTQYNDIKLALGGLVIRIGVGLTGSLQTMQAAFMEGVARALDFGAAIAKVTDFLQITDGAHESLAGKAKAAWEESNARGLEAKANLEAMVAETKDLLTGWNVGTGEGAVAVTPGGIGVGSLDVETLNQNEARKTAIVQEYSDRRELIGKEENERALIRLQQSHRNSIAQMVKEGLDEEVIAQARATHDAEVNQLLQKQSDEFYAEKDRLAAEDEAREEEASQRREEREREWSRRRLEILEEENAIRRERFQRAASDQMTMVNSLEGEDLKKGLGMATAGLSGLQQAAEGQDPYSLELERLDSHYQDKLMLMAERGASEQQLKDGFAQWEEERERTLQQKKLQMASDGFGSMAGAALAYYEMSGRKSKEAFAIYKAFAIGQAIMDTYRTAQAGAASLAGLGPAGPAMAAAWIAMSIATGFMRVKQIAATQPGSAATPTGGGGFSYRNPEAPGWTAGQEETKQERQPAQVTNYHIYGTVIGDLDEAGRALAPSVEKARTDGAAI